jgi:S-adenosylmethionine:tRNA ribosyltransferase-isomerase
MTNLKILINIYTKDLIIINDTKVIPARIFGYRKNTKGKVEIFIERILSEKIFICQIRSTRKLKKDDIIIVGKDKIELSNRG